MPALSPPEQGSPTHPLWTNLSPSSLTKRRACTQLSAPCQAVQERSLVLEAGADGVPGKAGAPGAADPGTCCREASGVSTDTTMDDRILCPLPAKYVPS